MAQVFALGTTFLLPKTISDFTNSLRGVLFVLREPGLLGLREALGVIFRTKSQDGLVTVDGHKNRMNDCPIRILSRCHYNAEGHLTSCAFRACLTSEPGAARM
jgi:hypothetical protein